MIKGIILGFGVGLVVSGIAAYAYHDTVSVDSLPRVTAELDIKGLDSKDLFAGMYLTKVSGRNLSRQDAVDAYAFANHCMAARK